MHSLPVPLDLSNLSSLLQTAPNLAGSSVSNALTQIALTKVTFESSLLPTVTWHPSTNADGTATAPSSWNPLAWLAPKVTVYPTIGEPFAWAPFGEPSGNYFLHALGVLALVGAAVAFFFFKALSVAKIAAYTAAGLVALGVLQNRGVGA